MAYKIVIVDDDSDLMEITKDALQMYCYEVFHASGSEDAFNMLSKQRFDLILLDINLPGITGFEVCKELRKVSQVPVIFISARTSEDDKITGLDIGGDDYLAKPYSLKELLSRINALIRRTYGSKLKNQIYHLGKDKNIEVDAQIRKVIKNGEEIKLSLKEFDLLNYLCHHPNQVLKKEDILSEVWGAFSETEISTVSVHIRWLREKLEDNPARPYFIHTVWGIGYKLIMEE